MGRRPFEGDFVAALAAAKRRDGTAFASLWRWLAPAVAAYFRHHGERDPEDLTSETFLRVFRDLERFEGDERSFRAWVFVVAHHRWIDARRAADRRPETDAGRPVADADLGPGPGADEAALRSIGAEQVRQWIDQLVPDQRDVLLLRLFGDLTIEQIAEVTRRSVGATKALQRRGLANLRRQVTADDTDGGAGSEISRPPVPLQPGPTVTQVP